MNPREQLVAQMVDAGKSDDEIRQALQSYDAQQREARSPKSGHGYDRLARLGQDMLSPKRIVQALAAGADTFSGGIADEALGAVAGVQALKRGQNPITAYQKTRPAIRAMLNRANEESGYLGDAAQIAGAFMGPAVAGQQIAARVPALAKAGLLRQAGAAGAAAGLTGAAQGAASAEPGRRLKGAAFGGGAGALLGAFLGGVAYPLGRSAKRYAGKLEERPGELQTKALISAADDAGVTGSGAPKSLPKDADPKAAEYALQFSTRGRPSDMRLADMSPQMQELAANAGKASPRAHNVMEGIAGARRGAQNMALADDVGELLGTQPGLESKAAQDAIDRATTAFENANYPKLWQAYPDPIDTPEVNEAWGLLKTYFPGKIAVLRRNAALSDQNVEELVGLIGDDAAPTLEGVHRLKRLVGSSLNALSNAEKARTITPEGADELRSLTIFRDRLRDAAKSAPGGDIYAQLQAVGKQNRGIRESLSAGEDVVNGTRSRYGTQQAQRVAARSGPGGDQALRQGATSKIAEEARNETQGSPAFLNKMAAQDATGGVMDELSGGKGAKYAARMKDRVQMARTNDMHKPTPAQRGDLLEGASNRGVALQFQEAGALGNLLSIQPQRAVNPLFTALGAVAGKAFAGNRKAQLDAAAVELMDLLTQKANNGRNTLDIYDKMDFLRKLQGERMVRQGGRAAALTSAFSRRDRDR